MRVSSNSSDERGTTMIELVIVIALIGILSALTVPNLEAWLSRMRLNAGTTKVVSTFKNTRQLALSEGVRYCLSFSGDTSFGDGNDNVYNATAVVNAETALRSTSWAPITAPIELAGWSNHHCTGSVVDCGNDLFKGVSLETGPNTTFPAGGDTLCAGFVFNKQGFLDNPTTDFTATCDGINASCSMITLISKGMTPTEQRTVWIDRGGNVRVTSGPTDFPSPL
jgi:prepilin-type N-terminal cleavage/methylation domain-containing protein